MKKLNTTADFINESYYEERYIISLTPDEFFHLRSAVNEYTVVLEDEIKTFEWLDTPEEKKRLAELERLADELYNLPF